MLELLNISGILSLDHPSRTYALSSFTLSRLRFFLDMLKTCHFENLKRKYDDFSGLEIFKI